MDGPPARSRLAMAAQGLRQPVVSGDATLSPASIRRMGRGVRSDRGGAWSCGGYRGKRIVTIPDLFGEAVRRLQSGDLTQAEALCRQVLDQAPAHAGAHHLLGLLALRAGRHDAAVALVRRAIELDPDQAAFYFNLGLTYMGLGQPALAADCYRQVLRLMPTNDQALNNLGNALRTLGQLTEAIACYREAVRCNPGNANAHYN